LDNLENYKYIIEARTKNLLRGTLIFGNSLEEVAKGYVTWLEMNGLVQKKMMFADLFINDNDKEEEPVLTSNIEIRSNGDLAFTAARANSFRKIMRPKKGFIPFIQQAFASYFSAHFGEYTLIKIDD